MADIQKLIERRNRKWQAAKNFLDEHTDKHGLLSAEDAAIYERMENGVNELSKNIERLQRQAVFEAKMTQPASQPLLNKPQNNGAKTGRAGDSYRKAALNALRTNFKNVSNILSENAGTSGGYLVPVEWDERLIDTLDAENVMRQLGTTIQTSGEHKITIAATKPTATWSAEGSAVPFGNATFSQNTLDAHKLSVAIQVTNELLADNVFDLENYILDQFGRAIANAEEDAFINGTGTNQPTGILKNAQVGVITKSATDITSDEIINLVYSLKRPYRKKASFIVNDNTLAAIRKLKDTTQNYLWSPSFEAGEPDRLLGYPIFTSAYMPTLQADSAVMAFGDFSYYNIGDRGVREFQELRELFAGNDMTGYLMKERVDAILVLPEAVQVLKMKA